MGEGRATLLQPAVLGEGDPGPLLQSLRHDVINKTEAGIFVAVDGRWPAQGS